MQRNIDRMGAKEGDSNADVRFCRSTPRPVEL